jgi:hypothetical protein
VDDSHLDFPLTIAVAEARASSAIAPNDQPNLLNHDWERATVSPSVFSTIVAEMTIKPIHSILMNQPITVGEADSIKSID